MTRFAESDRFEKVRVTANRAAHTAVVRALTGKSCGAVGVSEGTVTLDVDATVGRVKVAIGLVIARRHYLDHIPPQVQSEAAAAAVFVHLLHFLRIALRTAIMLSVVIALGAYFIGPGRLARATRSTAERGADSAAGWWGGHGVHTDPVGTWTEAHRRWLDLGTLPLVALLAPTAAGERNRTGPDARNGDSSRVRTRFISPASRPRSGPLAPRDPSGSSRPAPRTTDTDASLGRTALPEPKRAAHPERRGRLSNAREGDKR